jgi:hypothetical protein
MTNTPTGYSPQCFTCNAPEGVQNYVVALYSELGPKYTEISRSVKHLFNYQIGPDALTTHLTTHVSVDPSADTSVAPITGVVNPPVTPPKGWEPRVEIDGDEGHVVTPPQENDKIKDFSSILEEIGDLEDFEPIGNIKFSKWQVYDGSWRTSYKLDLVRKNPNTFELPTLYAEVRNVKPLISTLEAKPQKASNRTLVVPFSDLQAGKVGSRGDSAALVERVLEKKERLRKYIAEQNCSEAVFLDGGDVVESFENTAQQGFTNDLSIMQQLDLAGTLEQEFITLLAQTHDKVTVGGVPSNHSAWRKGKDILGRPSDDWGLFLLKQIQKAYKLAPSEFGHVEFTYPGEWEKGLCIPVQGLDIGLVHGEDSSLAQMENWWAKQVHGNSPIASADILLTAHYHTLVLKPSGRSQKTGKQKYWIGTPTLDNGSDWFANKSGSDSDPGLMAFVIDSEIGLDLQSFTVL